MASYLIVKADASNGTPAQQIADDISSSYRTVMRILNNHPGFKRSLKPIYPYGWWYDVSEPINTNTANTNTANIQRTENVVSVSKQPANELDEIVDRFTALTVVDREKEIRHLISTLDDLASNALPAQRIPNLVKVLRILAIYLERRLP